MKKTFTEIHKKSSATFKIGLVLTCLFSTWAGYAVEATNADSEAVAFFKKAINSPPEIEKFLAKRTQLLLPAGPKKNSQNPFPYHAGAISGTNYFLKGMFNPDRPVGVGNLGVISARSGSSNYQIGGIFLTLGMGRNALVDGVEVGFSLARQIVGMGVSEIEPGTVKWDGNSFTAKNVLGKGVHGSLQVSNNLPFRLEVSLDGNQRPFQAVEYTYTTLDAFAGFPAKFLITYELSNGLIPLAEVEFKSLVLATQHLDASFFSADRFADQITYTNIRSGSDLYVFDKKYQQMVKLLPCGKCREARCGHPRTKEKPGSGFLLH